MAFIPGSWFARIFNLAGKGKKVNLPAHLGSLGLHQAAKIAERDVLRAEVEAAGKEVAKLAARDHAVLRQGVMKGSLQAEMQTMRAEAAQVIKEASAWERQLKADVKWLRAKEKITKIGALEARLHSLLNRWPKITTPGEMNKVLAEIGETMAELGALS